jgi:holliday junction DNA helicase RuvA
MWHNNHKMISFLRGKILEKTDNTATVDVHGVGYRVLMAPTALHSYTKDEEVRLFIHTYVREDTLALYGFRSPDERSLFVTLIGVSGVGPKTGLTVLTLASPDEIRTAIHEGDISVLTRVSGIGLKTAERIVLELREKIGTGGGATTNTHDAEVIDALVGLGYKVKEVRDALRHIKIDSTETGERIKAVLQALSKK